MDTREAAPALLRRDLHGITTLTLNRPARYNVLAEDMLAALQAEFDALAADEAVRCVVLAAEGRAFSAGHDLRQMRARPEESHYRDLFARCGRVMQSIRALPVPVIAAVQGIATAAGCQLVATCDLAVAARSARFAVSGINVGLFCSTPAVALSRTIPPKAAFDMLMTGRFIDAETALTRGLVNAVVEDADLPGAAQDYAAEIASKKPGRGAARQGPVLPAGRHGSRRRLCLCGRRHGVQHDGAGRHRGNRRLPQPEGLSDSGFKKPTAGHP